MRVTSAAPCGILAMEPAGVYVPTDAHCDADSDYEGVLYKQVRRARRGA